MLFCYTFLIMNTHMISVDVSNQPELTRLIAEIEQSKTPRKLTKGKKTVAILMPVTTTPSLVKRRKKTQADYDAFYAAAGSWKDVDTDKLLENIYEDRRRTNEDTSVKL